MTSDYEAVHRRAHRVLSMVSELHKLGYQRIRIAPGMSPSGMSWRCSVTSKANTLAENGALISDCDGPVASFSSADGKGYFGWQETERATARDLAHTFVERFPDISSEGKGCDWEYAGWFVEVLGLAESGHFPIAYADWELPRGQLGLIDLGRAAPRRSELLLPPPGAASQTRPHPRGDAAGFGPRSARTAELVEQLHDIVNELELLHPGRRFPLDGHLVGSLGEAAAEAMFALQLVPASSPGHDAVADDGRTVEIKATYGDSGVGLRSTSHGGAAALIVLRLSRQSADPHEVVYNGPLERVLQAAGPTQSNGQARLALNRLRQLNIGVSEELRVPLRRAPETRPRLEETARYVDELVAEVGLPNEAAVARADATARQVRRGDDANPAS